MKLIVAAAILVALLCSTAFCEPARDANSYVTAVEKINAAHAKRPGSTDESDLAKKIPRSAVLALARIIKDKKSEGVAEALVKCGEAALDLAHADHFGRIHERLSELDPAAAEKLGSAVFRDRFLVRAMGKFDEGYLADFADLTEAILNAYDDVYDFQEWSKVPGKKIRILVHLEDEITRPPHFAPQFPYHSQIDMPVIDAKRFNSPTSKGHMMFYGLCHELGHLIAMWGDRNTQEDHHAWAHYTGIAIVDHMANSPKYKDILHNRRDAKWRSLAVERKSPAAKAIPSFKDRAGVLSLLIELHDVAGPKAIGEALNLMDEKNAGHRINHVRYYSFDDFKKALKSSIKDRNKRDAAMAVFPK